MAPQRAPHNRIWKHKSSTILFSSVQNNSTDRVRCHPWSALIFWNAKIKPYAWPPSAPFDLPHGSNTICFSPHTRNLSHSPCWAAGLLYFISFFCQNGLECDSMWNFRRLRWEFHLPHIPEYVIPGHFSKKKHGKKRFIHRVRGFYGVRRSCRARWLTVCVPPQLWSAMPSLECEEFVECEEFRVCVAGIETT